MRLQSIWLVLVLVAGFGVRLWTMRWPPFPIDMGDWIAWGERVLAVGPGNFYSETIFADYAPGYVYVMWLTAAIKNGLLPAAGIGTYHFLYRLTPMLIDLATGALIYNVLAREETAPDQAIVQSGTPPRTAAPLALLAAACHVFNPAIIFNSAVWGQIDATFTFGMLLAVVLLARGRAEWAVVSYVVAFMIKPQAISLAPLIGLVLLLRFPPRRWLLAAAAGLALAYVIAAPFLGLNAFWGLYRQLQKSVETYPYTSLFTYNLWALYGMWEDDRVPFRLGLSVRSTGTLLYLVGIVCGVALLVRQLRRTRHDLQTYILFATYFTFLPVMVLTRMHERYLYPVLPFLLMVVFVHAIRRSRVVGQRGVSWCVLGTPFGAYGVLSVLHTLNLYHVYTYYLNYGPGVPRSNTLFYFIDDYAKLWSIVTLLIFAGVGAALVRWSFGRPSYQAQLGVPDPAS